MPAQALKRFIAGFKRFQRNYFCSDHNLFELLREGQAPRALVIACSDSRVDPALLTDCNPGDIFVIRNVANLVPPYGPDNNYHGVSAAIEYAVTCLEVEHIIILGHCHCGGISSLMQSPGAEGKGEFIGNWMAIADKARMRVLHDLPGASVEVQERACEQAAILISLENLLSFPWIAERVDQQKLTLHGWYFDLENGALSGYDVEAEAFIPLVRECIS